MMIDGHDLKLHKSCIQGFIGEATELVGCVNLPVELDEDERKSAGAYLRCDRYVLCLQCFIGPTDLTVSKWP